MILYVAQVCLGITVWWLLYRLFFKGKASAKTNRFFLMGGLTLPFVLPLVPLSTDIVKVAKPILLPTVNINSADFMAVETYAVNWPLLVYALGFLAMMLYHLSGVYKYYLLKSDSVQESDRVFRLPNELMPFSFFSTIFLPEALPKEQEELIVEHEKMHIKLNHSWDVAFAALVQSALWFFPLIPVYVKDLRTEHEYQVDEQMLNSTSFSTYAETLLHVSLMPIQHAQFNSFSAPTLKKRIKMMTKRQKQNTWKLIFILPLIGSMVYLNACNKQVEEVVEASPTLKMAEVDSPPQFTDCATEESSEAQQNCFNSGIVGLIVDNMTYPEIAKEWGAEGTIYVSFIINESGEFVNTQVSRGIQVNPGDENGEQISEAFNKAAVSVFALAPKLIPAKKDGKAVAIEYVVPIRFALPPKETPAEE